MIVCKECGFHSPDDDAFCGSCGGFLAWTGTPVAPAAQADDDAEAEAPVPRQGLMQRVRTVLTLDVTSPGEARAAAARAPSPTAGGPGGLGRIGPSGTGAPPRPPGQGPGGPSSGPAGPPASRPPGTSSSAPATTSGPPGGTSRPPAAARPAGPSAGGPSPASHVPASVGGAGVAASDAGPAARVAVDGADGASRPKPSADAALLVASPVEQAATPTTTGPAPVTRADVPTAASATTTTTPVSTATSGAKEADDVEAVAPVKPAPRAPRPRVARQAPSQRIEPGDLVCGSCGEGNLPARNFCRRCGAALADAEVAKRRWWQRRHRRRRQGTAGDRPWTAKGGGQKRKRRGAVGAVYSRVRPVVAAAILVLGLVVGVTPGLREAAMEKVDGTRSWVMSRIQKHYTPLAPIDATSVPEDPAQPADNAVDANTVTPWVASTTAGAPPVLVVTFDGPFDLDQINLWNGTADGFKDRARAQTLHLVFDTGKTFDLQVADVPDQKTYDIDNGAGIRRAEVYVTQTYPTLGSTDVAVSEIEFLFQN